MNADWTNFSRAWLYPAEAPYHEDELGIRRRVRAQRRHMIAAVLGEYVVAALIAGIAVWKLATGDGLDAFVHGFALLWFTAIAVQFSAANRRGLWQPARESTRDYLELALERVCRREAAVRFAWLLYALQVVFLLAWYPATWYLWPLETWPLIEATPGKLVLLGAFTACLAAWTTITRRRNRGERRDLERLKRELTEP